MSDQPPQPPQGPPEWTPPESPTDPPPPWPPPQAPPTQPPPPPPPQPPPTQQWGPPPGPYQPYGYPGYAPRRTEGNAVAALVLAICSFVVCPVIPAVIALFLAASANRNIRASNGALDGASLVTAAKIIAWINIGLALLVTVIIVIAVIVAAAGDSSSSLSGALALG